MNPEERLEKLEAAVLLYKGILEGYGAHGGLQRLLLEVAALDKD